MRKRAAIVPRGHAVLQLAFTVLMAAYMGVFTFTGSSEGGASTFGGNTMVLLVPPIIIASGLLSGANERFHARQRTTTRQWIALGAFFLAFVALVFWGIADNGYPWWLAPVFAVATLLVFGIPPLRVLLRAPREVRGPRRPHPLPRVTRVVTILIGLFFAAMCLANLLPLAPFIVTMVGLLAVVVALSAQTASWGLLRTGFEWRRVQWIGFGVAALALFALAALTVATGAVSPLWAVVAAALAAASVIVSAFVPGSDYGASEA